MPITPAEIMLVKIWSMGLEVPQFLALAAIGAAFFAIALTRFRKTIGTMV